MSGGRSAAALTPYEIEAGDRVATELYPLTLAQARGAAVLQLAVMAPLVILMGVFSLVGFPRETLGMIPIVTHGTFATVRDVRWWLWVRTAAPVEAARRLQERDDLGSPSRSRWLPVVVYAILGAAWWTLRR